MALVKEYISLLGNKMPIAASLTESQWEAIDAIYWAGGGDLAVTSLNRPGAGTHSVGAALDAAPASNDDYPLLFTVWDKLRQSWPGGLGLGIDDAARHIHLDRGDKPEFCTRSYCGQYQFLEISRPDENGHVDVVGLYPGYDPAFRPERIQLFEEARSRAMAQYGLVGIPGETGPGFRWKILGLLIGAGIGATREMSWISVAAYGLAGATAGHIGDTVENWLEEII